MSNVNRLFLGDTPFLRSHIFLVTHFCSETHFFGDTPFLETHLFRRHAFFETVLCVVRIVHCALCMCRISHIVSCVVSYSSTPYHNPTSLITFYWGVPYLGTYIPLLRRMRRHLFWRHAFFGDTPFWRHAFFGDTPFLRRHTFFGDTFFGDTLFGLDNML